MTEKQLKTEQLKTDFLEQLNETGGNVLRSCETVGASRATMLRHYDKDDQFRANWDLAVKGELILEKPGTTEPENQTKPSIFDLTEPDLSEDENLRKPHILQRENFTKLNIQNDANYLNALTNANNLRDDLLANPEIEKASESEYFPAQESLRIENDTNEHPGQEQRSI